MTSKTPAYLSLEAQCRRCLKVLAASSLLVSSSKDGGPNQDFADLEDEGLQPEEACKRGVIRSILKKVIKEELAAELAVIWERTRSLAASIRSVSQSSEEEEEETRERIRALRDVHVRYLFLFLYDLHAFPLSQRTSVWTPSFPASSEAA